MPLALNTSHPLYANIVAFVCVDDDNTVKDLKAVQTCTPNAAVTIGSGTYGRHFKTLIASNNAQGVTLAPGWSDKPSANPNATAFIVVNNLNVINGTRGLVFPAQGTAGEAAWSPSLTAAGLVRLCANGVVTAEVGTTALLNNGAHSFGGYVQGNTASGAFADGTIEMTRGNTGNAGTSLVKYIGGAPSGGWGGVGADYVYVIHFDKVLNSTELADLHASLGAGNSFALLSAGTPTPIAFTGTIPAQSATVGTPFSLNAASYFSGTQTPFAYAIQTGTLPAGLSFDTATCIISGTPTGAEAQAITIRGTDADLATADSNSFTITVSAGGDVTAPTFTVAPAVSSVTQTGGTATATINETGSIFYVIVPNAESTPSVAQVIAGQNASGGAPLDSGSAVGTTTLSNALTGLTASTAYKACFVARDDESTPNVQASVTVVNFTTAAVPTGTITSEDLSRNNGGAPGVVALTHIDVRLQSTGALAVRKTGISTNSSSIFSFSDAAITTGSTYIVSWIESGGQFGIAYNVVAS